MARFNIKTSGKGMLPKGRLIGFIEAKSPEEADKNLVEKNKLPREYLGFFAFEASEGD